MRACTNNESKYASACACAGTAGDANTKADTAGWSNTMYCKAPNFNHLQAKGTWVSACVDNESYFRSNPCACAGSVSGADTKADTGGRGQRSAWGYCRAGTGQAKGTWLHACVQRADVSSPFVSGSMLAFASPGLGKCACAGSTLDKDTKADTTASDKKGAGKVYCRAGTGRAKGTWLSPCADNESRFQKPCACTGSDDPMVSANTMANTAGWSDTKYCQAGMRYMPGTWVSTCTDNKTMQGTWDSPPTDVCAGMRVRGISPRRGHQGRQY